MTVDQVRRTLRARIAKQAPRESARTARRQADVARRYLVRPTRKA